MSESGQARRDHARDLLQSGVIEEVQRKGSTRDTIADKYRSALYSSERDRIDWARVNGAILERFSPSGLDYIKKVAWERR